MFKFHAVAVLSCCIAVFAHAEVDIVLSGTVKDADGAAVEGAIVSLASDATLSETTSVNGEFTITNITALRNTGMAVQQRTGFTISGNQVRLCLTLPVSNGSVALFSGTGKLLFNRTPGKMDAGIFHYTLPQLADGFYLLSVITDGITATRNLVRAGGEFFMSNTYSGAENATHLVRQAAAQDVDTLIVKKEGYITTKQLVASYKQTGITIVLTKEGPVYAYSATVENTCADCVVPELPDGKTLTAKSTKLPDPFKKLDGNRISKKSEWRCRRAEILAQAMKYIYGDKPAPPEVVTGTVTNTKVTVHVEDNGKKMDFSAAVKLPSSGTAPYPAIIAMGSSTTVVSKVSSLGVAIITYAYSQVATPGADRNVNRNTDFKGPFYDMYPTNPPAGNMMAWAWGASRIIDVLQKSGGGIIDYRRLAVTGCSREGKDAFAVGLFDERVALTIPEETSLGGIVAYRIADAQCSEKTQSNYNDQIWLCNSFSPFVMNTSLLPIDANELIATFAPRGLYGIDNSSSSASQMCPQAGNMAFQGGRDVYNALGCDSNLTYNSTPTNTSHCIYSENYTKSLTACVNKFLLHKDGETGKIEAGTHVEKKDWIDWTAPPLEDDTDIYTTD